MAKSQSITEYGFTPTELPTDLCFPGNYETFYFKDTKYENMGNYPHWHHYYEIMLILQGKVAVASEGTRHNIPEGSLVIIPPRLPHSTIVDKSTTVYERLLFHWTPKLAEQMEPLIGEDILNSFKKLSVLECNVSQQTNFQMILEHIAEESKKNDAYSQKITKAKITELFLRCGRSINNDDVMIESDSSVIAAKVIAYINAHYENSDLSLQEIAEKNFISQGYLSKLFKKYSGSTVYQYIIQTRLLHARDLMLQGASVMEACVESGFSDYTSFLKSFKATLHITPKEYVVSMNKNREQLLNGTLDDTYKY